MQYNKYKAKKTKKYGYYFDSKLELYCFEKLKQARIAFNFQVPYILQENVKRSADSLEFTTKTLMYSNKKIAEFSKSLQVVKIVVDFTIESKNYLIIIDTKGVKTAVFNLKKKLLLAKLEKELKKPVALLLPNSKKSVNDLVTRLIYLRQNKII